MNQFQQILEEHDLNLTRANARLLQLNVGKLCNLTCIHCHVNAGPSRKEIITRETIDRILSWQQEARLPVVDLTGGAPEMIPDFRYLIERLRAMNPDWQIIDRCNLTILLEPGHEGLAEFLKEHRVEIVASMPCYSPKNVNEQRGEGVFDASIAALQLLNRLGYGVEEELPLHLVYNPNGPFLPGPQHELEADYKRELKEHFGIVFNQLYSITNLPVSRFASWLRRNGHYETYLQTLIESFNPATVEGLMCRDTVNVSWEGEVFDCDFNQMAGLHIGEHGRPTYLWEIEPAMLDGRSIRTAAHCFGCTAGAGSSCGGALEENGHGKRLTGTYRPHRCRRLREKRDLRRAVNLFKLSLPEKRPTIHSSWNATSSSPAPVTAIWRCWGTWSNTSGAGAG